METRVEDKLEMQAKIFKLARIESEWLGHYGHEDSRKDELFDDVYFYERMLPIGYSKVYTPLHSRCPMGYVYGLDIRYIDSIIYGPRNHRNNVYTCLEFVIHNKIDGYLDLINKIIKKQ